MYFVRQEEVVEGACSCAAFPVGGTKPIIEQTLQYSVNCKRDAAENCQQLCVILAKIFRHRAPVLICEKLDTHVENLKLAIYTKSCDTDLWMHTGLAEYIEPICCRGEKIVTCDEATSIIEN
ncbi:hypothetical protein PUN28_014849 [Cardiocondyla obscurior]|uniref:Uncharacterized protein n=1 Tax=Cardiocondyla obscurior TaxID=286306 RepID=A0AAW2EZM8_9HYME